MFTNRIFMILLNKLTWAVANSRPLFHGGCVTSSRLPIGRKEQGADIRLISSRVLVLPVTQVQFPEILAVC